MKRVLLSALVLCLFLVSLGFAADLKGKKVLYIDSYHTGYAWSDGIVEGVKNTIGPTGAELKVIFLDTKRNGSEEFKKKAGADAKAVIDSFKPDVVIAGDDNASKYLIVPYFKGASLPFVFCGVNWESSMYGFPWPNVTGMEEVSTIKQLLTFLGKYAKGTRVAFLGTDNETSRKEAKFSSELLKINFAYTVYPKTFEEWKAAYIDLQGKVDILFCENNAGITGWDDAAAKEFAEKNISIPVGTIYDWMMPYSVLGYIKSAQEQGEWAADAAIKILNGASPSSIAIAQNKKGELWVNLKNAKKLGVNFDPNILKIAKKIQ